MPQQYIDMNTLRFVLKDVNRLNEVLDLNHYSDHDEESIDMFIDSIKDFSDKDLFPHFKEMDEDPARFEDGKIIAHKQVGTIMKKGGEMGIIAGIFDYEDGGMQLPAIIHTSAYYIMDAANNHLPGYPGLTLGAAELIIHFGNETLKEKYVPKMLEGQWGGTMCLTEPQAGSSLSDITTSATPHADGHYTIKGQKIFISGGDHEYCDNFIHLVLARIEGAPQGTKGISLFVVPKHRIKDDGTLEPNDLSTAGDFQKLGQRGYCTTHLMFGENDDCRGWLVGQANSGLKYMFKMMNGARIAVGRGGAAIAMAAYQASLEYANERSQGRALNNSGKKDLESGQTLIINHPDVRRMLLLQKAVSEGSLSLILKASKFADFSRLKEDEAEKEKYYLLLELLTPVVKTYPAEMGQVSVSNGLQILGGYGFCSEYILQQYLRDIRISAIYEGTTGIQSLDLLGRKVPMGDGKAMKLLLSEINEVMDEANNHPELKPYSSQLSEELGRLHSTLQHLMTFAGKGEYQRYLSDANIFMELFSHIIMSWLWLEMALEAKKAILTNNKKFSDQFYESKIHTMKYYFKYELSKVESLCKILKSDEVLTLPVEENIFI